RSDPLFEGFELSNKFLLFRFVHLLEVGRNNPGSREECANTSNEQEKRKQEEGSATQISTKSDLVHREAYGEQLSDDRSDHERRRQYEQPHRAGWSHHGRP